MDYYTYYEARDRIVEIIEKDLLGPVSEHEIICEDRPLDYYILGKLYPQESITDQTQRSSSEDCGELDEEGGISLSNSKNPSSFGLSFSINPGKKSFRVRSKAARYCQISEESAREELGFPSDKYKQGTHFWKREPVQIDDLIVSMDSVQVGKLIKYPIAAHLEIYVFLHKIYPDGSKTVTVSMVNEATGKKSDYFGESDCAYFQPYIGIYSDEDDFFGDVRRNVRLNENPEIAELEMLYSRIGDFASGHGCAVGWKLDGAGVPICIYTDFFPTYELLQMMPSTRFASEFLQMKKLSASPKKAVISAMHELTEAYRKWIGNLQSEAKTIEGNHDTAATINIKKCNDTLVTIEKSIDALNDEIIFRAFSLANKAMFLQRKQSLINTGKYESDENIRWYPFQLAFFLQEIISFADIDGEERKKVDLLWFPTGGGKTEAYLGIAAFTIFLRRLRLGENGKGVTVLMRYTMRLLSFQQFERASALICACEIIRREEKIPGGEIGIGLWAGQALTPNYILQAAKILGGEEENTRESEEDSSAQGGNPVQLEKCPWCASELTKANYSCDLDKKRMEIKCGNPHCGFHKGLPVYLIDEEIYEHTPAFIVATIDKFAQVALNYETSALFGKKRGYHPPELIIQDELHLISGPLGTITGLYEAGIKKLCEYDGTPAKIIASTATIRNAKEQISSLYAADYTQFPPQGLDINDSFFAEVSKKSEKPARLYLGCMGIGTSPTTMMIRVMSAFLYATRYIAEQGYDDKIVDSFWTQTAYFNSLRELGGAIVRVVDDIQDRFMYLRETKFHDVFPLNTQKKRFDKYKELTSREKSEKIGVVIQKELKEEYKSDGSTDPYDFLLSSNMISVGVDVGRLGTMVVVGQPKTTSEYIQATSRVGRETPGIVIATYNQGKSRDRSHYEDFTQYHSMFYRFVEATSVTPFSDRSRDRALQALYVILCRNLIPELANNNDAKNFRMDLDGLAEVRQYILDYVKKVDPDEHDHVAEDIDEIEYTWKEKAARRSKLKYRGNKYDKIDDILFDPDYLENSRFRGLNTMRSVETTVRVVTPEER